MGDPLKEALDFAAAHVEPRGDHNTEVQHPTDLITMDPYWRLTLLLLQLDVLPADVHLINCDFWEGYTY